MIAKVCYHGWVKKKINNTAKKIKKAIGQPGGLAPIIRKGEWELVKEEQATMGRTKKKKRLPEKRSIGDAVLMSIARERAGGATTESLADKYGVSDSYIKDALNRLYVSSRVGREILKGVLLENAVSMGLHARKHIKELTPMQAVVATGVMTSRFVELEKHTQAAPPEVDFSQLAAIGEGLKELRATIGNDPTLNLLVDVAETESTD